MRKGAVTRANPRSRNKTADSHVALLRGVNVGGKNRLAMAELALMFERAGCRSVRTYIQSGNVVFEASGSQIGSVTRTVERALEKSLGHRIVVVVRSASELRALSRSNPFLAKGVPAEALHVALLADLPAKEHVASLDPDRSRPDAFEVRGREIYLHLPNGGARTKLTNDYFDRTLRTTATVRNWRTVLALCELAGG